MSVLITGVEPGSVAEAAGIRAGDTLLTLNDHEITDVLDFRFYETESHLAVAFQNPDGDRHVRHIVKGRYASLGLVFQTYLMDEQHSCRNQCIFCFIDQLPPGMRSSLYFKDDDSRLSFLFGNYVTLTNMSQREVDRIIQMHISPINVSVHTMNPELRCKMMNNRFAGKVLAYLSQFTSAGIRVNCQLVLCPGINDGKELDFTLEELYKLGENVQSIACVPVGVTRYREGLYPLQTYTKETALQTVRQIEAFGDRFKAERGARTVYAADEFYLLAGLAIPESEFYEDFAQLENGVGLLANLKDEFLFAFEEAKQPKQKRRVTFVTGECPAAFLKQMLDETVGAWDNLDVNLLPVANKFFGGTVNVSGLLTGQDMLAALQKVELGDEVLIPACTLKQDEDIFLDDMTLEQLRKELGVPVTPVENTGEALLHALCGETM